MFKDNLKDSLPETNVNLCLTEGKRTEGILFPSTLHRNIPELMILILGPLKSTKALEGVGHQIIVTTSTQYDIEVLNSITPPPLQSMNKDFIIAVVCHLIRLLTCLTSSNAWKGGEK